jgi:flagellar basal-body rod protein FlgG
MIRALYSAATGMQAQQLNLDVIANNLANVNTTGFKRSRPEFQDLAYQTLRPAGARTGQGEQPVGLETGLGTRVAATRKIFSQGTLQQTDNPLDLAIDGEGFFQVLLPDGTTAYTRAGVFQRDGQGQVVTADGYVLQPAMTVPAGALAVTVSSDGIVSATTADSPQPQQLGQLTTARFVNPAGLRAIGRTLFVPTAASGDPELGTPGQAGFGTITQGFVEASNVSVVEEMVQMITAQRAFEASSKAIRAADDMLGMANNVAVR